MVLGGLIYFRTRLSAQSGLQVKQSKQDAGAPGQRPSITTSVVPIYLYWGLSTLTDKGRQPKTYFPVYGKVAGGTLKQCQHMLHVCCRGSK